MMTSQARSSAVIMGFDTHMISEPCLWSVLKRSLANLAKRDIGQLTALVKTRLRRMQYRPGLIEGFLAGTRLDFTPFCNPRN
jgi:hypothetical protein